MSADLRARLDARARALGAALRRAPRIGIAGPQGSGKSTLAGDWAGSRPGVAHFSLDDVYLSRADRAARAARESPLFRTRGPPGTHDLNLAWRVIDALAGAGPGARTPLPRFDKLADEPLAPDAWPVFVGPPDLILVDGWCLGAAAEPDDALAAPINALEAEEDQDGRWRRAVNAALAGPYAAFWDVFDLVILFEAPDFAVVPGWRREQEAGLRGVAVEALPEAVGAGIDRFVAHFERVTRSMLAGRRRAEIVIGLGPDRGVRAVSGL